MKITYDKDADAMFIELKEGEFAKNKKLNDYTILDLDKDGNLLGIEILFVKEKMPNLLKEIKVENLIAV